MTCKPSNGATKSTSVIVKSGEKAMAAFKLQDALARGEACALHSLR